MYDVIDKQDHLIVQNQLSRNSPIPSDRRLFLCRINVSRNSRRQLRFGDQKVIKVTAVYFDIIHFLRISHYSLFTTGSPCRGSLPAVRACLQPQRIRLPGFLHSGGLTGDTREHRSRRDQYLYHDSLDGHEVSAHR